MKILRSALLIAALSLCAAYPVEAQTVTFDFDTGTPALSTGQSLPLAQTAGGLTAEFSSPTLGAGGFSIQSANTTFFKLSLFSGNYLYPNSVYNPALDIQFNQQITSITFPFATADFQQVEVPTTIQLTAYQNSTGTTPVGTATAHGTYASDTMPMGTLSFNSAQPFNVVEIAIPPAPLAASDFLVDNIAVTLAKAIASGPVVMTVAAAKGQIAKAATLSATLKNKKTGAVLAGEKVQFSIDGADVGPTVVTNSAGKAVYRFMVPEGMAVGPHTVTATCAGYPSASNVLTVSKGPVKLVVYNVGGSAGKSVTLSAKLADAENVPISGARLGFSISAKPQHSANLIFSVAGNRIGSASTDATGTASLSYSIPAGSRRGAYPVAVDFAGDASHLAGGGLGKLSVK